MFGQDKIFGHHAYYLFELFLLLFGIILMLIFSQEVVIQLIILVMILFAYIALGFIHHHIHHTMSTKIVLEYTLVSMLILFAFLFFNIGRL